MQTRRKQTNFIRKLLYTLKRGYGFPITLHKIESESLDYETGARTSIIITQKIARAIMLPGHMQRQFESDSQPTNFKYGALYDISTKKIIIDANDLGTFNIEIDDYFIWNERRWQIAEFYPYELDTAFIIFARAVEGTIRHMVESINIESNLQLTQGVVNI